MIYEYMFDDICLYWVENKLFLFHIFIFYDLYAYRLKKFCMKQLNKVFFANVIDRRHLDSDI